MRWLFLVLDHLHADPQFGFPHEHYHIDGRFYMEPRMAHEYQLDGGHTAAVIKMVNVSPEFLRLENRMVACVRQHTGLKFPAHPTPRQQDNLGLYEHWYASYIGKSCAGRRWPHFGSEMLEKNGQLVCPMHHLIGDMWTHKIISRVID